MYIRIHDVTKVKCFVEFSQIKILEKDEHDINKFLVNSIETAQIILISLIFMLLLI